MEIHCIVMALYRKYSDWQWVWRTFEGADDIMFLDLDSVSVGDNSLCYTLTFYILLYMCSLPNKIRLTWFMQLKIIEVKSYCRQLSITKPIVIWGIFFLFLISTYSCILTIYYFNILVSSSQNYILYSSCLRDWEYIFLAYTEQILR